MSQGSERKSQRKGRGGDAARGGTVVAASRIGPELASAGRRRRGRRQGDADGKTSRSRGLSAGRKARLAAKLGSGRGSPILTGSGPIGGGRMAERRRVADGRIGWLGVAGPGGGCRMGRNKPREAPISAGGGRGRKRRLGGAVGLHRGARLCGALVGERRRRRRQTEGPAAWVVDRVFGVFVGWVLGEDEVQWRFVGDGLLMGLGLEEETGTGEKEIGRGDLGFREV